MVMVMVGSDGDGDDDDDDEGYWDDSGNADGDVYDVNSLRITTFSSMRETNLSQITRVRSPAIQN
jgi:hypothetical protein